MKHTSVVGPLLFLPSITHSPDALLQDDINRISMWFDANYLNIQKCIKLRKLPENGLVYAHQHYISVVSHCMDSYKYLGILLSSDLSLTWHIESLFSKVRKLTGLIYRRLSAFEPESLFQITSSSVHNRFSGPPS